MPASTEERVGVVEAGISEVRSDVTDLRKEVRYDMGEIRKDVAAIRDSLAGRPSWAVSMIITILASSCVGLLVALANEL